jgi:hypothetical protein
MDVLTNKKQQTVSLQCRIQQSNIIKNHYELEFSYIELPNVNKVNNQILILNENQTDDEVNAYYQYHTPLQAHRRQYVELSKYSTIITDRANLKASINQVISNFKISYNGVVAKKTPEVKIEFQIKLSEDIKTKDMIKIAKNIEDEVYKINNYNKETQKIENNILETKPTKCLECFGV